VSAPTGHRRRPLARTPAKATWPTFAPTFSAPRGHDGTHRGPAGRPRAHGRGGRGGGAGGRACERPLRQVPVYLGWCRLDCDDATRATRVAARGWAASAISEALADAEALRRQIPFAVDTSHTTPQEAAGLVALWIQSQASPPPTEGNDAIDEP
jgi:hypothetical protein